VTEFILRQYDTLFSEYMAHREAVPPGHLVEVSLEQLEADPIATLRRIYTTFGCVLPCPRLPWRRAGIMSTRAVLAPAVWRTPLTRACLPRAG